MPIPVIVYAGAYVAGSLAGTALGTTIAKKVLPSNNRPHNITSAKHFDLTQELNRLGMKNPF